MKREFVKCESCKTEIPAETCALAACTTTIEGKSYIFCCEQCAQRYKQKKTKKKTK